MAATSHAPASESRVNAYVLPVVKTLIDELILELATPTFRRTRRLRPPSFPKVEYLLHVHAGILPEPANEEDRGLLEDLRVVLATRGVQHVQ